MTKSERQSWRDEKRLREGKVIADRYLKEICSGLNCSLGRFMKMRRKTGVYRKAMIELVVHLRDETEWTFRHMGQYLKCSADYIARLYYDKKVERS